MFQKALKLDPNLGFDPKSKAGQFEAKGLVEKWYFISIIT
jgi:hypothetical protein